MGVVVVVVGGVAALRSGGGESGWTTSTAWVVQLMQTRQRCVCVCVLTAPFIHSWLSLCVCGCVTWWQLQWDEFGPLAPPRPLRRCGRIMDGWSETDMTSNAVCVRHFTASRAQQLLLDQRQQLQQRLLVVAVVVWPMQTRTR